MERFDVTESRAYSVIYNKNCGLWTELKVQTAGLIVLHSGNSGGYGAS